MTYTMSRDYDALYDLLCGGGEAFCRVDYGWATPSIVGAKMAVRPDGVRITQIGHGDMSDRKETVIAECTRLSLEWLAPVDIAEVIKAGDKMYEAMVRYQMDVDEDPPMKHRDMMEAWTDATAKHRTT